MTESYFLRLSSQNSTLQWVTKYDFFIVRERNVYNFWKREQSSLYSNVWRKSTRHALTWRGGTYDTYCFLFISLSRREIQRNVAKTQLHHTKYRNFSLSADPRKMMYVLFMKTNDALHPFLKFDAHVFLLFFWKQNDVLQHGAPRRGDMSVDTLWPMLKI
jgi:hypothetical protein